MSKEDGKQHLAEEVLVGPSQSHLGAQRKVSRRGQQEMSSSSLEGSEPQQEIQPMEEGDTAPASKDVQVRQDKEKQHQTSVTTVREGEVKKQPHLQESSRRQDGNQKCEREDGSTLVLCQVLPEQEPGGKSDWKILEGDLRSHTEEEPSQSSAPEQSTHLRKSPAESPEEGWKGKSHKCLVCGKKFRWPSHLIYHQRVHSGEKLYQCDACGKSFRWISGLKQHLYLHSEEKPYKCNECGKGFRWGTHLILHQRIHSGEKPFLCYICGKSFRHASNLKQHQRLHSQEKLYKCEECGKSFAQDSGLAQHQQIHSGKKPFQCNVCGKSFRRSGHLRRHQAVHSREKASTCEECGKSLAPKSREIQTSEKPTRCEECGKSVSHKSDPGQHPQVDAGEKLHKSK